MKRSLEELEHDAARLADVLRIHLHPAMAALEAIDELAYHRGEGWRYDAVKLRGCTVNDLEWLGCYVIEDGSTRVEIETTLAVTTAKTRRDLSAGLLDEGDLYDYQRRRCGLILDPFGDSRLRCTLEPGHYGACIATVTLRPDELEVGARRISESRIHT